MSAKHDDVMELSGKLSSGFTIEGTTPSVSKTLYMDNLPETVSKEAAEALNNYNSVFFPASTHAFGEKAIEAMKGNPEIQQMTIEIPMVGKDHYDVTINRQRTYRNPQDESTPVVKWGQVDTQLVTHSAKNSRGEMNAIRDKLSAMALEQLFKA